MMGLIYLCVFVWFDLVWKLYDFCARLEIELHLSELSEKFLKSLKDGN